MKKTTPNIKTTESFVVINQSKALPNKDFDNTNLPQHIVALDDILGRIIELSQKTRYILDVIYGSNREGEMLARIDPEYKNINDSLVCARTQIAESLLDVECNINEIIAFIGNK